MRGSVLAALTAVAATLPSPALADTEDWSDTMEEIESPEHFGLEFRVGIYTPTGLGSAFTSPNYFGGDVGPMLGFGLQYYATRIPYLGLIGAGVGLGWSQWSTNMPGGMLAERNSFTLLNLRAVAALRFDTLAREFGIPLVLTPKIGLDVDNWSTKSGSMSQASGWSFGPRFAAKLSLELDFLQPRAARQLDEEWGINHSALFFEMYYSMAGLLVSSELPVSGWGWAAGLEFTF